MKKVVVAIIGVLGFLFTALLTVVLYAMTLTEAYDTSFMGAMADKHTRLNSINEPKIVLIGGSSMCFGVDSAAIERELKMPVVDFGLYAMLGTYTTMEFALSGLDKGDIVVIAPEIDAQAYSMYTNPEATMQALEAKPSMLWSLSFDDYIPMLYNLPKFIEAKKEALSKGASEQTIYSRDAFNEYGDIKLGDATYVRTHNTMSKGYLDTNKVTINTSIIESAFIDYVNDYVASAKRVGATVYFDFPPVNELAIENTTAKDIQEFYDYLCKNLDASVIGHPTDYIMDYGYFFDSNYHLNDSGVTYRTFNLVNDIKKVMSSEQLNDLGISSVNSINVLAPSGAADIKPPEPDDSVENYKYFVYSDPFKSEISDKFYITVTGLSEEGKKQTELTVPAVVEIDGENYQVNDIDDGAFANERKLETVNVPYSVGYGNRIFENSSVRKLNILLSNDLKDKLPEVGDYLLDGNDQMTIYVPANQYTRVVTDYFWSKYSSRIKSAA